MRFIRDGQEKQANGLYIYKQFSTHERDGRAVPVIKTGVGHRTMVFIDVFIQRGDDTARGAVTPAGVASQA